MATETAPPADLVEMPDSDSDDSYEAPLEQGREAPSIWDAAEEVRERLGREDDGDSEDEAPTAPSETEAPEPKPEGETAEQPSDTTPVEPRLFTEQAALDRVLTLIRQGRINELPPEVQGQYRALTKEAAQAAEEEAKLEEFFNERYVTMRALQADDPEEYNRLLEDPEEGEALYQFMREYQRQHPDVSPANPRPSPRGKTEVELRKEIGDEYGSALYTALQALAEEKGVTDFAAVAAKAQGRGVSLMVEAVDTAIETGIAAGVAAQIEKIRAEERAAAQKEAQVQLNRRLPAAPVNSGGQASAGGRTGPVRTIWDAAELNRRGQR